MDSPGVAAQKPPAPGLRHAHAREHFLVRFASSMCETLPECWPDAREALRAVGVSHLTPLVTRRPGPRRDVDRIYIAHLVPGASFPELSALEGLPGVDYVEPDYVGQGGGALVPDDPDFELQWGFEQRSDADVDATLAWALEPGQASTVIAILDTGVALDNPDLGPALLPGYDVVNNDDDPTDDHGHGTNIAGLAGARGFNTLGISGLCSGCSLLPVKVLDSENFGYYSWWVRGLEVAVDGGAHIINLSLGGRAESTSLRDAIRMADAQGVVLIAAMMNDGERLVYYPAAYPETVAVGATGRQDSRSETFVWGGGSNFGDHIDLVAPGASMMGPDGLSWSGTSQATAMVSGAAGLLYSARPELSSQEIARLLIDTAEDQIGPGYEDTPGFDIFYGNGRLNAHLALEAAGVAEDADQDGYSAPVDSDDTDPEIHPEALELPDNTVDEDCDPRTRDGDRDGDGFPSVRDCDDTRASVNPDADEIPGNGLDDDCDPSTSDGAFDVCGAACQGDVAEPAPKGDDDEGCCAVLRTPRPERRNLPLILGSSLLAGMALLRRRRRRR